MNEIASVTEPLDLATLMAAARHLAAKSQMSGAIELLRLTVAMYPDDPLAWANLSASLGACRQFSDSIRAAQRAITLNPGVAEAHQNLASALVQMGDAGGGLKSFADALLLDGTRWDTMRNYLCTMTMTDQLSLSAINGLHRSVAEGLSSAAHPLPKRAIGPGDKIRVGYLSSDLRDHPIANTMMEALLHHDQSRFEVHYFPHNAHVDIVADKLFSRGSGAHDITHAPEKVAAELIRSYDIDILVSLAGSMDRNRPLICQYRAAPVQISLFDVATSCCDQIDHIITDEYLVPVDGREWFVERPIAVPGLALSERYTDLPSILPRPERPLTYGCFNAPAKIAPSCLKAWGRILAAQPEAHLVMGYYDHYANPELRERIEATLADAGANPEHVFFIIEPTSKRGMLDRYNLVDVVLDPFPMQGGNTTYQALAMGMPVITWAGNRMMSRWTASVMHRLGQAVPQSIDEYIVDAIDTGTNIAMHDRHHTRDRFLSSSLCDGIAWIKNLEAVYEQVMM